MVESIDRKYRLDRRSGYKMSYSREESMSFYQNTVSRAYRLADADVEAENVMEQIRNTVEKQRADLDKLNAKLATYKVSVRSKEATNKHLLEEIENMKETFLQTEETMREKYAIQIEEANCYIKEQAVKMASLNANVGRLEVKDEEIQQLQKQVHELQQSVQKKEGTIGKLNGKLTGLENQLLEIQQDNERIRKENDRIMSEHEITLLKQNKSKIEFDTLAKEKKNLEITLHAENQELRGLLSAFKLKQRNLEEVHEAKFTECFKSIKAKYESQLANLYTESQEAYDMRYKQLEAEKSKMRELYQEDCRSLEAEKAEMQRRIVKLRSKMTAVTESVTLVGINSLRPGIATYQSLLDEKTEKQEDMEQMQKVVVPEHIGVIQEEIGIYISETSSTEIFAASQISEPVRVTSQFSEPVRVTSQTSEPVRVTSQSSEPVRVTSKSSEPVRVTSQSSESARMPTTLSIKEVESSGSYIMIHNSSKQELDFSNWIVDRVHPKGTVTFKIPNGSKIGPEKEMKIYSSKNAGKKGAQDIVATCKTWGTGQGQVKIKNEKGQEVIQYPCNKET